MVDAALYFYLSLAMVLFIWWDATRRKTARVAWLIGTAVAWPLTLPLWMAKRPLRPGEVRRGGRAWNGLKHFAMTWSILWGAHILLLLGVGITVWRTSGDAPDRSAGMSMLILLGIIDVAVWIVPAASALGIGLWLRKPEMAEQGASGAHSI